MTENYFIDLETQGETKQVICGTILKNENEYITFWKPNRYQIWNKILKIREKTPKKKAIYVYAHNHAFDFARYGKITKGLKIINKQMFIYELKTENGIIKFLDTYNLSYTSVKQLGEIINLKKGEISKKLLTNEAQQYTEKDKEEITKYNIRDCLILKKFLDHIKKVFTEEQIKILTLKTISNLAIKYLSKNLQKDIRINKYNIKIKEKKKNGKIEERIENPIFYNQKKGIWIKPKYSFNKKGEYINHSKIIQETQRDGRVLIWKKGKYNKIYHYDINSLFPYCMKEIKVPDLRSEKYIEEPTKKGYKIEDIINKIGISFVILYNKENNIGLIPVRDFNEVYFPLKGRFIAGYYTNLEIKKAIEEGYEIKQLKETIIYKELPFNPFKEITEKLYKKKKENTGFKRWFYKALMNMSYGKLAQIRFNNEERIEDYSKIEEIKEKKITIIDNKHLSIKEETKKQRIKKHYAPIIPAYIRAKSRIIMYETFKKVGKDKIIYSDTDSIWTEEKLNNNSIKIGKELGEWKEEIKLNREFIGKKARIEEGILRMSGFKKQEIKEGYIAELKRINKDYLSKDFGTYKVYKKDVKKGLEEKELKREKDHDHITFIDEYIKEENKRKEIYKFIRENCKEFISKSKKVSFINKQQLNNNIKW